MIDFRNVPTSQFATEGADLIAGHITRSIEERGVCHFAVSGGRAPWAMFGVLAAHRIDWARVHIWQVDERVAPDRDVDRNSVGLKTSLLALAPILAKNVHLMDVTTSDLADAAAAYSAELAGECDSILDLVHLGLGSDGHTASWPPDDAVLGIDDRDVAITSEYNGFVRMTLTVRCVNRARHRVFLITGADKESATAKLESGDDIPASLVATEDTDALVALQAPLVREVD